MKKETIEEAAENYYEEQSKEFENNTDNRIFNTSRYLVAGFIEGAKWKQERMYSEENVFYFFEKYREDFLIARNIQVLDSQFKEWFNNIKK